MENPDYFIHLAEIAGVFVGFGALIAVRAGGSTGSADITQIRWVVSSGIWVVIAGLLPIVVGSFGLSGQELWVVCAAIAILFLVATLVVQGIASESGAERAATMAGQRGPLLLVLPAMIATFWLPLIAQVIALVLVVLGVFPVHDEALYLAAVGLGLLMSALALLLQVFAPATASGPGD